jgi:peptidoglycan/LPS O-acetylase OafA/YrhL
MIEESKVVIDANRGALDLQRIPDRKVLRSGRVPELDGVRAIAIWWVLVFHIFPDSNPAVNKMPHLIRLIVGHGWLGVDLFFVLSGFLITGVLLESKTKQAYFKNFYGRRALRILPVYLCAIFVMWICYRSFNTFFILCLAFLANFNNLLHVPYPLGGSVFWSLAVEEHFYLVWPLVVRFTTTRTLIAIGAAIIAVEITIRGICMARGIDTYELSWFRFDSLVFGAMLAVFVRSQYCTRQNCVKLAAALVLFTGAVTVAAAPFGAFIIGSPVSSTLRYAHAYVSFGVGILLLWALRGHWLTGIFRSRFARVSADLSYCIYLIHLGVLDAYFRVIGPSVRPWLHDRLGAFGDGMVSAAVIFAITFLLAQLSRKFLETPFLRLKDRFV